MLSRTANLTARMGRNSATFHNLPIKPSLSFRLCSPQFINSIRTYSDTYDPFKVLKTESVTNDSSKKAKSRATTVNFGATEDETTLESLVLNIKPHQLKEAVREVEISEATRVTHAQPTALPLVEEIEKELVEDPWYLGVDPPVETNLAATQTRPAIPNDPPVLLELLVNYIHDDMGLDDINLMDLREIDPPPALGPSLIMIFGTARSERHLHVACARLQRWLRYTHHVQAHADGLIGAGRLKTKLRRIRRKSKLMGSGTMIPEGGDNGISTGWICVNLGTIGNTLSKNLHVTGNNVMMGFGGSHGGTTIVVQVMTEAQRTKLDLEKLWEQNLENNRKMREELLKRPVDGNIKLQLPHNWSTTNKRKLKKVRQQAQQQAERGVRLQ